MSGIIIKENAIPSDLINDTIAFFEKYSAYVNKSIYEDGQNTKTEFITLSKFSDVLNDTMCHSSKDLIQKLAQFLKTVLKSVNIKYINDLIAHNKCYFSSFSIRKTYGPTRPHCDGAHPVLYEYNGLRNFLMRCATLIIVLTDNNDELHFPEQDIRIKLTKGTLVIFPSYWTHPHFTTHDPSMIRMSLQCWLMEDHPLKYINFSEVVNLEDGTVL